MIATDSDTASGGRPQPWSLDVQRSAAMSAADVLSVLDSGRDGIGDAEADRRRAIVGPNAVRTHRVSGWAVLVRQLRSALLALLLVAATVSFLVGQRTDAVVIGVIMAISVGLGFLNEYRAERAGAALHDRIRHRAVVVRSGQAREADVTELVPGDVVRLELGQIVPADLRLLETTGLTCDEAMLTGESVPVHKSADVPAAESGLGELSSCVLMGTVVRAGSATGVVVATGPRTAFGRIAVGLGRRHPPTEFQVGLARFSTLLARVAAVLTTMIFVINLTLHRPILDAILFSLAIAVGITPQLLPAIVTTSLATGTRRLARRRVLVKCLVCVEDLGNIEVLFTDKTGTLTAGALALEESLAVDGRPAQLPLLYGLLANEATVSPGALAGGNALDQALWRSPDAAAQPVADYQRWDSVPFDHERRRTSVLVDGPDGRTLIVKGAPEEILARCQGELDPARKVLDQKLTAGGRVIAVAARPAPGASTIGPDDEHDLTLVGVLVLSDPPKSEAAEALARLAQLGVAVKVVTGDHPAVAGHVCRQVGLPVAGVVAGRQLAGIDDDALPALIAATTVFARVSPEDKARLVRVQRLAGRDVAFLGDGVNDALALHSADVGVSVDSGADVARDAADVLLLDKDLGVLADGVTEGRRIFANTVKYVLMGTSSNFGNMFSAAGASAFLPFLPMLPGQILLNNLLYDVSQIAIPTDRVDPEQLARPAHWDLREIRRFMLTFGPLSSIFDFLTFAILLSVLHAGATEFRTGWFVESVATQTLIVFVIRTHASPFWRSRPSLALVLSAAAAVTVAWSIPYSPLAGALGFTALPPVFLGVVVVLVAVYLALVETTKRSLFAASDLRSTTAQRVRPSHERRQHRRAARFTTR
ncbi:Mg2+-importing ATPase [Hamadaea flava]|uniref:Magnesium-transporting ATPase, P-type 1 n=1 Tax=Hamadaea flava TaxID=1742688 RepID=A0ABV8LY96_9ACTN|nr:magnesium-translocating P-type ATPase [Hamadaea flava]MCP2329363.1 Mg2+-importing ATPase [Hamadaea flava]